MQLNGSYYPYSRFDDVETLKHACVIFDSVRFLEPSEVDYLMTPQWDRQHLDSAWLLFKRTSAETRVLREAGVLIASTFDGSGQLFFPAGESLWWAYEHTDENERQMRFRIEDWLPFLSWALQEHGAVPFTDDPRAERMSREAFRHLFEQLEPLLPPSAELDYALGAVAKVVMRIELPPWELKSFDDVLSLREALSDSLKQLRVHLASLAATLQSRPWDPDFQREIEATVRREVAPAAAQLRRQSAALPRRYAAAAAQGLLSYKPLAISSTMLVGVPPVLAAGAAAGAAVIETATKILDARESVTNHGLSFFVDHRARS